MAFSYAGGDLLSYTLSRAPGPSTPGFDGMGRVQSAVLGLTFGACVASEPQAAESKDFLIALLASTRESGTLILGDQEKCGTRPRTYSLAFCPN
jgi:hypothetical protein